jgi:hypothetical protein
MLLHSVGEVVIDIDGDAGHTEYYVSTEYTIFGWKHSSRTDRSLRGVPLIEAERGTGRCCWNGFGTDGYPAFRLLTDSD